jgi:hypothetical protein
MSERPDVLTNSMAYRTPAKRRGPTNAILTGMAR